MPHIINKEKTRLKPFLKNRIQKKMYELAAERNISTKAIEEHIKKALKISPKQLTYFLENIGNPPDIKEICIISQILECTIDDLIELSK